ncbi:MAG: hypothetical protein E6K72_05800 [Candidatus Eisenbacteria bacterium]|uniref:T9SS type A sorting domain-containing protein n=1 Tax=Eiseniibacteriota bacterium TaxID=2212470 RepID=A0A538SXG1_UNCEI|nr:MAG: hypothetical protein E6K72_05800 [Candidatus Eisenbacteria bacterium]
MQSRYPLRAASALFTLVLCSLLARPGAPDALQSLPAGDSPVGAMVRLLASYRLERLDDYAPLLLPGFRFFFGDSASRAAYPEGFTRVDELASARHLFEGFTDASGVRHPAARSIESSLDTVCVGSEPEEPDSAAQYQVVVACGLRLHIEFDDDTELDVGPACHEFHFARGDVAARGPDQPGDADHWYLWRWVESSSCEAMATARALASRSPALEAAAGSPGPPRILSVPNPAHGVVSVSVRLTGREPARLIMFDVAGRRVLDQDLGAPGEAVSRFELRGTAGLPAGLYWLRATQGGRIGPAKAVVLL